VIEIDKINEDKATKIIKKLFGVYSKKVSLKETIKEMKEGSKEL